MSGETVKILVDGREVDADPTKPLIAACHAHRVDVPMYCYHPGLTPVGSCRICQVQVQQGEMPPRVVVACKTPVVEGMVVDTEAPGAHDARRQCLEFLLKNHPLDCPICDKAGECDLQDFSFDEGQTAGRSVEPRRNLEKRKSLGDVIVLDQERCILCSRCVRFFEDVTEKPQLTVAGLGSHSVISTFADRPLEGNYQGNIADICPVGALTLKRFRFQARVWNLRRALSTCGECSRGCAITTEVLRGKELKRIRPRFDADVNRWWMCDTGRFALEVHEREDRLVGAVTPGAQGPEATEVEDALDLGADVLRAHAERVVVASPWLTNEEGEALLALAQELDAAALVVVPPANDLADDLLHTGEPCPNRRWLVELGFEAASPEDARARLGDANLLVGERVGETLFEGAAADDATRRLVVLDTATVDGPGARVQLGVPSCIERAGTWTNVDGIARKIAPARSFPAGVSPTPRLLDGLRARLAPSEAAR